MGQNKNATQGKPGPIERMFHWVLGILVCATMIGLWWKYIGLSFF